MIASLADKDTAHVYSGEKCKRFPAEVETAARRKLAVLNQVTQVPEQLWTIPGLRTEKLQGNRKGQWSVRVNAQYRICFTWDTDAQEAHNVELTDYH